MIYEWNNLIISAEEGKARVFLFGRTEETGVCVTDIRTAGADTVGQDLAKQIHSGAGEALCVKDVRSSDGILEIVQEGGGLLSRTVFEKRGGGTGIYTEVTNLTDCSIVLENVSAVNFSAIDAACPRDKMYLYRFHNSHHTECQPRRLSFDDLGLFDAEHPSFKRICGVNAGSWTSKQELPQLILEDVENGRFAMLQIESCGGWYWEISDDFSSRAYLTLSGGNFQHTGWKKVLRAGESYVTPRVGVCTGGSLCDVLAEITEYRRSILRSFPADETLPAVFNEYMHLSWDSPEEARTLRLAPVAKKAGADVYVIDCGWHDEEDGWKIYPYVGKWKESARRFPRGVRFITDYIRSCGMKAGLWIEPEVVGTLSGVTYPEDAYIRRNGKRVCAAGRCFLDFRHPVVREAMSAAIGRMVMEYGADYIKIDCNQDSGAGTEVSSASPGDGLEQTSEAFFFWLESEREKYPQVIFESCASGGQRLDWRSLSASSIVSTSDQIDYRKYPYISANILSAVLPEQAGVWSYPYVTQFLPEGATAPNADSVATNMVNGILGRLHLASDLEKLDGELFELVREGVQYGKTLADFKKRAVPYLPLGFTRFGAPLAAAGLRAGNKLILAVWDIAHAGKAEIPLCGIKIKNVRAGYPSAYAPDCAAEDGVLDIRFQKVHAAVLEIETKS